SGRRSNSALIKSPLARACHGHPSLHVLDAFSIAGVVGQELGYLSCCRIRSAHVHPKTDRLFWFVTGKGHEEDSDMVGLRFLAATKSLLSENAHLSRLLDRHAFVRVMGQCMGDFMR